MRHDVTELREPDIVTGASSFHELVIQMKCAHGIGKLAEVHLEERGNRVDVLENETILEQVGYPILVKGDP